MRLPRTNPAVLVAIILSVGMSLSLVFMTGAALYVVVSSGGAHTLGENTTQVLTGWGGGMLGVLGAFVGYAFGGEMKGGKEDKVPPGKLPPKPPRAPSTPSAEPPAGRHADQGTFRPGGQQ